MNNDSSPGAVTPPSDPAPAPTLMSKIDWKHVALGVVTVLGALGYGGVIPPLAGGAQATPAVCAPDPAFQSDVRAALAKLADQQADMRERMARVESALGAASVVR